MKRRDLSRHLERQGCVLIREGHSHTIFDDPRNGNRPSVPRHREIPEPMVRVICRQLHIPPAKLNCGAESIPFPP